MPKAIVTSRREQASAISAASLAALLLLSWATPADAQDLPAGLSDLMREANPKERQTLENVAKRRYPAQRQQIDLLLKKIADEEQAQAGKASIGEGWSGEGSLGGSVWSGNTDEWNFSAALRVKREGPLWEHRVDVSVDIGAENDERNLERVWAEYRARRNIERSRLFLFGSLRYERDRFNGISHRFTQSAGGGYHLIDSGRLEWDIYGGPALRQTDMADGSYVGQFGLFAATDFKWEINDTITLRQYAGTVLANENKSFKSVTSLTSNLYGELSARFEFTFEKETDPPAGVEGTDKFSRVSLVYGF